MGEAKQIQMPSEPTIHAVLAEIKELMAIEERPHNVKDTAKYLGIHHVTLHKWMREGKIPSKLIHQIGNAHFFFLSEIRTHLKTL